MKNQQFCERFQLKKEHIKWVNGTSSGCGRRRRPSDMEGVAANIYIIDSRVQPTRGGPPAGGWAGATTPQRKKLVCYKGPRTWADSLDKRPKSSLPCSQ
jgi:hypothetical protein